MILPHLQRTLVLGRHTFTQLVRMKVYYFVAIFALLAIGSNSLDLVTTSGPEFVGAEVLFAIKNVSIGCMSLFSLVLAIVATGLLIPRDVEDRTLYTILAKPVPRLDYLIGKLLGIIALILASLIIMDLLMVMVLHLRTEAVIAQQISVAEKFGYTSEMIARLEADTRALGPSWNLQAAVLAVFLRAVVMASVALLLSTFSTSSLFTAGVGFMVLFAGFFQADARDFYFDGGGLLERFGAGAISLMIPDLQLFNVIDTIIEGQRAELSVIAKLGGLTLFYALLYTFASWLIFSRKEF